MLRAAKFALQMIGSLIVVALGSVILLFLGRPIAEQRGSDLVVDGLDDDPGTDVDGDEP